MTLQNITSHSGTRWPSSRPLSMNVAVLKVDGLRKFMARKVAVAVALSSCEEAKGLIVGVGKSLVAVVGFDFLLGAAAKFTPDLATLHCMYRTVRSPSPLHSQLRNERECSQNIVLLP